MIGMVEHTNGARLDNFDSTIKILQAVKNKLF